MTNSSGTGKQDEALRACLRVEILLAKLKVLLATQQTRDLSDDERHQMLSLVMEWRGWVMPTVDESRQQWVPVEDRSFSAVMYSLGEDSHLALQLSKASDSSNEQL